ncbi:hypothetical protein prwr041_03300 [Prevotella herbatica]|uniref:Fibrobacter succinogenes major paralogous domain-containing protein n=2 Tax=Prevotella herbatica TaxID=2801997 RepID=A0ABN6EEX9_9BACT|nr:hypothetical protein prwr041_03300 [Prevotella herbatica]
MFASCAETIKLSDEDSHQATLSLTAKTEALPDTRALSSTGTSENIVDKLAIFVFDSNGNVIGYKFIGTGSLITSTSTAYTVSGINTRVATGCTICAIANVAEDSLKDISNVTMLKAAAHRFTSADEIATASNMMMYGETTATIDIAAAGSSATIGLKRLAARHTFTVKTANGFKLMAYQLCHVPLSTYYCSKNITTNNVLGTNYNPAKSYGDAAAVAVTASADDATGTTFSVYQYENLVGKQTGATSMASRNINNAPADASYLLLYVADTNTGEKYINRVYLGGNLSSDYTDYSVYRNLATTYSDITIKGADMADANVERTHPEVVYIGDAIIGNYLYADGTNGRVFKKDATVGIIYSNQLTQAQYNANCRHGKVMALKNANNGSNCYWSTNNGSPYTDHTSTGHPYLTSFKMYYDDISSGYDAYSANSTFVTNIANGAWYYCNSYQDGVSKSFTNSGWYLPSIGEWWDIIENLGNWNTDQKAIIYDKRTHLINSGIESNLITGISNTYFTNLNKKIAEAGGDQFPTTVANAFWTASEYDSLDPVYLYMPSTAIELHCGVGKDGLQPARSVLVY